MKKFKLVDETNEVVVEFQHRDTFMELCRSADIPCEHLVSEIHHPNYDPEADTIINIDNEKAKWIRETLMSVNLKPTEG